MMKREEIGASPVAGPLLFRSRVVAGPLLWAAGALVSGCIITAPINEGPAGAPPNTIPRIDQTAVQPSDNMQEFTLAGSCTDMQFSVNRVLTPDARIFCYPDGGIVEQDQNFAARFFVTPLPTPGNALTPMASRPYVPPDRALITASPGPPVDCDVLTQESPFTLKSTAVPSNGWVMVEIVVSDFFKEGSNRAAKTGYGTDAYTWIVRKDNGCP